MISISSIREEKEHFTETDAARPKAKPFPRLRTMFTRTTTSARIRNLKDEYAEQTGRMATGERCGTPWGYGIFARNWGKASSTLREVPCTHDTENETSSFMYGNASLCNIAERRRERAGQGETMPSSVSNGHGMRSFASAPTAPRRSPQRSLLCFSPVTESSSTTGARCRFVSSLRWLAVSIGQALVCLSLNAWNSSGTCRTMRLARPRRRLM